MSSEVAVLGPCDPELSPLVGVCIDERALLLEEIVDDASILMTSQRKLPRGPWKYISVLVLGRVLLAERAVDARRL